MPIDVTISSMDPQAILPQEAADALRAYRDSVIPRNHVIYSPAMPIRQVEPKTTGSRLATIFLRKSTHLKLNEQSVPKHVTFDALLIKTSENTWHVVDNTTLASGAFGAVKKALRKIVIHQNGEATIIATDDVVKIQKLPAFLEDRAYLLRNTDLEFERLHESNLAVCPPIQDGENLYLVMPNCGVSLDDCMPDKTRFDFNESFQMAHGLLNDMFSLQKNEIIHRDIKPANICRKAIIGRNGVTHYQYIFVDFGLSVRPNEVNGDISGTPDYMAPETLRRQFSIASDVYALAGIFLEIFGADPLLFKNAHANAIDTIRTPYKGLRYN